MFILLADELNHFSTSVLGPISLRHSSKKPTLESCDERSDLDHHWWNAYARTFLLRVYKRGTRTECLCYNNILGTVSTYNRVTVLIRYIFHSVFK